MPLEKNFWRNKPVLVSGATGFVGSHLVRKLEALGAVVAGVSRRRDNLDVTNRLAIEAMFRKRPAIVYHLAGSSIVEKGQEAPYETFHTNVLGTLNLLELARIYRIPRMVIASTVHVYGAGRPPFHEDDPPRPSRPYETSKTATDILAQSYADSFALPVVIPRFVNIYGPADLNFTRLIPKTIQHLLAGKPMPMWGGRAKRQYLYIDDAVEAYLLLGSMPEVKLERNRILNFGAGRPIPVEELIRRIGKLAGLPVKIRRLDQGREGEILDLYVSSEKARRVLGWRPRVSLMDGLARTITWYRGNAL